MSWWPYLSLEVAVEFARLETPRRIREMEAIWRRHQRHLAHRRMVDRERYAWHRASGARQWVDVLARSHAGALTPRYRA